ncbi:hypothetical protein JTE90_015213 [Oedothorax gibbosus]|uniref:ZP domain-containing protein n=1 Tax=Oedothorax gibbosus TaxID=931172 RepID=A0AAV6V9G0_9ARAC|nr:hypothetical protein JTE90_015213 [Oedothorax gibbosus]
MFIFMSMFYNVTCGSESMHVTLNLEGQPSSSAYLQNLKGYPGCEPHIQSKVIKFHLSLNESGFNCGVSKMLNKETGHTIFYHRVVIEGSSKKERELLFVQCVIPGDFNMEFVRQDWLRESVPYNSTSPKSSSLASNITPYVHMAIREKGLQLDTSAVVHPGSLLDLLIYLDKQSADHYDISLRYLTLTDATRSQEEVVVMNGCSVDPFVLEVFPPSEEGVLRSQFRAFKFQSSDFVVFLATVSVCLQQCVEVDCYGEADQSGRRKREIPKFLPHYSNEAFEAEISAFLKIEANVEGEIIIEESTNDTLDMYDAEYSGEFSDVVAGSFTATSHGSYIYRHFAHWVILTAVGVVLVITTDILS